MANKAIELWPIACGSGLEALSRYKSLLPEASGLMFGPGDFGANVRAWGLRG